MSSAVTTRMLVLGVVSIFEPANGYQIRRELLSWGVEHWADLKPGSVYSMLATLTKQGLVVRHDLMEAGRSVAVYGLSENGRVEFRALVSAGLDGSRRMDPVAFKTALSFTPFLPRERVLAGIASRVGRAEEVRADLVARISLDQSVHAIPPHVVHSLTLDVALVDAEITWLRDFISLVEAGFLTFEGEGGGWLPPGEDSSWEMVEASARYREQIATLPS